MITANEVIIMGDPGLVSGTGLPVIDYVKEPLRPKKKFTTPITIERQKEHQFVKMPAKELTCYFTKLQSRYLERKPY